MGRVNRSVIYAMDMVNNSVIYVMCRVNRSVIDEISGGKELVIHVYVNGGLTDR